MKYKPGDKVRIRNDLVEYEEYGRYTFVPSMTDIKGEQVIKEINNNGYILASDKGQFIWTDEMFEDEMFEDEMFEDEMEDNKMDNKNITVNMENLSEEERNTLLELIKKLNKTRNEVWIPKYNEVYYFIDYRGAVSNDVWYIDAIDNFRYSIGNCFKTEEEAKFALEKQKVITELKRFAQEHNEGEIDWSKKENKNLIYYNHHSQNIIVDYARYSNYNAVYFTSKEIAEQAVQEIGEERLKKYYFEVND